MHEVKMKKKEKTTLALCLGVIYTSILTTIMGVVNAEPKDTANPSNSPGHLLSKENCDHIMEDTNFLEQALDEQLSSLREPDYSLYIAYDLYNKFVNLRKHIDAAQGIFATDSRMLPLYNEMAYNPSSKAVHRKIYRLCGAKNFNAHVEEEKHQRARSIQRYPNAQPPFLTDWEM